MYPWNSKRPQYMILSFCSVMNFANPLSQGSFIIDSWVSFSWINFFIVFLYFYHLCSCTRFFFLPSRTNIWWMPVFLVFTFFIISVSIGEISLASFSSLSILVVLNSIVSLAELYFPSRLFSKQSSYILIFFQFVISSHLWMTYLPHIFF